MYKYKIERDIDDLIPIFVENGYTEKTVAELKRNIQKVLDLHRNCCEEHYNSQITAAYISNLREKHASVQMSRSRKNTLVKASSYVCAIATSRQISPGIKEVENKFPLY